MRRLSKLIDCERKCGEMGNEVEMLEDPSRHRVRMQRNSANTLLGPNQARVVVVTGEK